MSQRSDEKRALAVMARTPHTGETKTRLIPRLGAAGAVQAHRMLVENALGRIAGIRHTVDVSLWVTQRNEEVQDWATHYQVDLQMQPSGDLGERMHSLLCALLEEGADYACVMGTDCPELDALMIEQAFAMLQNADVVIVPAEDGGYGLIGLKKPCARLFQQMAWGGGDVLSETLSRAREAQLNVHCLPVIWDVDTPEDWLRFLVWQQAES